jgi:uncharacterized membrane protein
MEKRWEAHMSNVLVITFEDEQQAFSVLQSLKDLSHQDQLSIKDTSVIVKDKDGKVHVKNAMESGVKWGAFTGAFLGVIIAGFLFPVAGLLLGAGAGALIGKTLNTGLDKHFIEDVRESMAPGSSAILFVVTGNTGLLIQMLEPYQGKVFQSSFDSEAEEGIERALK